MVPPNKAIARRASELWNENGRPPEGPRKFWLLAEQELQGREFEGEHPQSTPVSVRKWVAGG